MRTPPDIRALAEKYMGGLTHVHTRLSNYRGHFESDQSMTRLIETLRRAGVPLQFVIFNEHASNPTRPKRLGKYSLRTRMLLRKRWLTHIHGVPILHGFEASLLSDGSTDLTQILAENAAMVIASRHKLPDDYMTDKSRITSQFLAACDNGQIDVIGHPLRHIEPLTLDWPKIFQAAARTGTVIEANLNNFPSADLEPERYAIWRDWLHMLGVSKCKVSIGSDLHNTVQLRNFIGEWKGLEEAETPNRLRDFILTLAAAGIGPERVINSSFTVLRKWLALDKRDRAE